MSAIDAARSKVERLQAQHKMYKEKLQRQEQEIRTLQLQLSQTKTVVNITMPQAISKAHREYVETKRYCGSTYTDPSMSLASKGAVAGYSQPVYMFAGVMASTVFNAVFWVRVVMVLAGLVLAGFVSKPLQWRAALH